MIRSMLFASTVGVLGLTLVGPVQAAASQSGAGAAPAAVDQADREAPDPRAQRRARVRQSLEALKACLDEPSQDCALRSALLVTAAEDLSIDRSKILLSVADSLHAIGDQQRAERTLGAAKREAQEIGIGFATDTRFVDVAEIQAKFGEMEAARITASAIGDEILRARAFGRAALALANKGRGADAAEMLGMISVESVAQEYALQVAEIFSARAANAEAEKALETAAVLLEQAPTSRFKRAGEIRLAAARARLGQETEARDLRDRMVQDLGRPMTNHARARLYAEVAALDLALDDAAAYTDHLGEARTVLGRVKNAYERDYAVADVAIATARGGNYDAAIELAEQIENVDVRTAFAQRLARLDSSAEARRVLSTFAHQTSNGGLDSLDQPFTRDEARFALVTALVDAGSAAPAVDIVDTMEDDDAQARGLAYVARLLP